MIKYGITDEKALYRIHVCVKAMKCYVFPVQEACRLLKNKKYQEKEATQPGVTRVTAKGFAVPISDFDIICEVEIPERWMQKICFSGDDSVEEKGKKALTIALAMLRAGKIHIPMTVCEVVDRKSQIQGFDIIASTTCTYQIKCDYRGGGDGSNGTTGNLFLQTHESNPLNKI